MKNEHTPTPWKWVDLDGVEAASAVIATKVPFGFVAGLKGGQMLTEKEYTELKGRHEKFQS